MDSSATGAAREPIAPDAGGLSLREMEPLQTLPHRRPAPPANAVRGRPGTRAFKHSILSKPLRPEAEEASCSFCAKAIKGSPD